MADEITISKTDEFSVENLEVIKVAEYLGLKFDDLDDKEVSEKLEAVWNVYQKSSKTSFRSFVEGLSNKLGKKIGVHPLDKIYYYLPEIKEQAVKVAKAEDLMSFPFIAKGFFGLTDEEMEDTDVKRKLKVIQNKIKEKGKGIAESLKDFHSESGRPVDNKLDKMYLFSEFHKITKIKEAKEKPKKDSEEKDEQKET